MKNKIDILIVDTEKQRKELQFWLENKYTFLNIETEEVTLKNLEKEIAAKQPQLLLINISLNGDACILSILNVLKTINATIIIINTEAKYAVPAINTNNVAGYITDSSKTKELEPLLNNLLENISAKTTAQEKENYLTDKLLAIPTTTSIEFIETKDIVNLEADGKYTVFYLADKTKKVATKNIGEYEKYLQKDTFFRIHHKYIINLKKTVLIKRADGNYCQLANNTSLPIAKRRLEELRRYLRLK